MRKFKLLKDTPTIKAGTIFQEVTSDYDKSRELVRIMPLGSATSPQWTIDDIINFDEWFEEVGGFEERKPKSGDTYKFMGHNMTAVTAIFVNDAIDIYRVATGNCYPLDTPDKVIIDEQLYIPVAMHRLKMAAKRAWFEFNGSEGPDWKSGSQRKHNIYYSHAGGGICLDSTWSSQEMMAVYFPTEESARAYIDNNQDDLKLLFGVE